MASTFSLRTDLNLSKGRFEEMQHCPHKLNWEVAQPPERWGANGNSSGPPLHPQLRRPAEAARLQLCQVKLTDWMNAWCCSTHRASQTALLPSTDHFLSPLPLLKDRTTQLKCVAFTFKWRPKTSLFFFFFNNHNGLKMVPEHLKIGKEGQPKSSCKMTVVINNT